MDLLLRIQDNLTVAPNDVAVMTNCNQAETKNINIRPKSDSSLSAVSQTGTGTLKITLTAVCRYDVILCMSFVYSKVISVFVFLTWLLSTL